MVENLHHAFLESRSQSNRAHGRYRGRAAATTTISTDVFTTLKDKVSVA